MTIVRVGATEKYSVGWEAAFGKGNAGHAKSAAGGGKHPAAKTATAKAVSTKMKATGKKKSKKRK